MGRTEQLIKSKERVHTFAEVYTPKHIVNDMCDLISADLWRDITSTFLEPTCGNGNFLAEIFSRKLKLCTSADDGLKALESIYGIDIQADNVEESKQRMFDMFVSAFPKASALTGIQAAAILESNIVCGDSLKIMERLQTMSWHDATKEDKNNDT